MSQQRLRLLAVLAAVAAAVAAVASWSNRPMQLVPIASATLGVRALAALESVEQLMAGITDEAAATAALPRLREQSARLLDIRDAAEGAPAERAGLAAKLGPLLPGFEAKLATTIRTAGVDVVAGPVLRQIGDRLRALTKG